MKWLIVEEAGGGLHTVCPKCRAEDEIVEVDRAIRWNRLRLTGKNSATASTGSGDWEFDDWYCQACGTDDLEAPDGFEITDWV